MEAKSQDNTGFIARQDSDSLPQGSPLVDGLQAGLELARLSVLLCDVQKQNGVKRTVGLGRGSANTSAAGGGNWEIIECLMTPLRSRPWLT